MATHVRTTFLCIVASVILCAVVYHHHLRHIPLPPSPAIISVSKPHATKNYAIHENSTAISKPLSPNNYAISTTAVLLPNWEVLVIFSPETSPPNLDGNYFCLFDTKLVSPARFSGVITSPDRVTFTCSIPSTARRSLPLKQPMLIKSPENPPEIESSKMLPLLRWSYLVYDSLSTEDDVVLFVKGINTRRGFNREPNEFNCVFSDGVRTSVTSSKQEVFRCKRPSITNVTSSVTVSLEIVAENRILPSVAYYTPTPRKLDSRGEKSLLCASTMVYNVAKFLREWVLYHSKIGVQKFLLYDNGSDDVLGKVVDELVKEGFDITTYFWVWPKTQEGGFSHSTIYAKEACTWMMYVDVDEFVYSPSWHNNVVQPSKSLLHSLKLSNSSKFGQFNINCLEFGPSGQKVHPKTGVTQGYNCRRRNENRHKSIVLLDAVNDSLFNVIHHFNLKSGYKSRKMNLKELVVNHYKYQAWPEFKAKFRRRVSAYVVDWTDKVNPNSNDRAPGVGYLPVEPQGWPQKFCEVYDNKLKDLTLKWFGMKSDSGYQMAW
ncbi:hypothetical protein ACJIZ3_003293 [Penstemon smallii]|uniref:Glycosyltransferase family 92 protein n=1 Tax=Penstemon smallii TaxID=265156 RepID=A0ABD3UBV6_9LAMI